jgi:hypothetical protein
MNKEIQKHVKRLKMYKATRRHHIYQGYQLMSRGPDAACGIHSCGPFNIQVRNLLLGPFLGYSNLDKRHRVPKFCITVFVMILWFQSDLLSSEFTI